MMIFRVSLNSFNQCGRTAWSQHLFKYQLSKVDTSKLLPALRVLGYNESIINNTYVDCRKIFGKIYFKSKLGTYYLFEFQGERYSVKYRKGA